MRTAGWLGRLEALAAAWAGRAFAWGTRDCALLAFAWHDALTGGALERAYRGRYGSRRQALRFQRRYAIDAARVLAASGWVQTSALAEPGDLVLAPAGGFACAHAVLGARCLSVPLGGQAGYGWTLEALALPDAQLLRLE